jgi:O-antigen ligase
MAGTSKSFATTSMPSARGVQTWPGGDKSAVRILTSEKRSILGSLAFVSLWLLVFAIPWEDAITIPGFGTSARLLGMITLGLGALAIVEMGKIRRPTPGHLVMALFVLLSAASYMWSLYPEGTITQIFTYIQLFAMVWFIWELAPHEREQIWLMRAYVFGTLVSGTDTVYRFLSHQESGYQRYAGAGLDANDLGLMMALSIPISYCLLLRHRGKLAWVYLLQMILAVMTLLLTASRGASLAGIVALVIVPVTYTYLKGPQKLAVLVTVGALICCAVLFVPGSSWERLSTLPSEFEKGTLTGRTVIWAAGWEVFRHHPVFGIGANAFRPVVSRVLGEPIRFDVPGMPPAPPAHNTFLSVLVEEGVVGLAVYCTLLGTLLFSLKVIPSLSRKVWIVCLIVWVVGVSSLTWEMRKPTWFLFAMLLAQSGTLPQKRRVLSRAPVPSAISTGSMTNRAGQRGEELRWLRKTGS